MSLVEELTEQFSVLDVPSYGKCVIIPAKDFISDLEKTLKESGVRIYRSHMGGPVIQIPLDDLKGIKRMKVAGAPEPSETLDTSRSQSNEVTKSPSAPVGRGPNWSAEEDELLTALRNKGLIEEEVAKEFCERYPQRTPAGVHNRISRLLKAGKIKHKSELLRTAEKEQPENRPKRGRGRPPKPKPESVSRADISTPNETPAPAPTEARASQPFDIKTTLTLNITVDCSDRQAVANFLAIVKELGSVTKKEAS